MLVARDIRPTLDKPKSVSLMCPMDVIRRLRRRKKEYPDHKPSSGNMCLGSTRRPDKGVTRECKGGTITRAPNHCVGA